MDLNYINKTLNRLKTTNKKRFFPLAVFFVILFSGMYILNHNQALGINNSEKPLHKISIDENQNLAYEKSYKYDKDPNLMNDLISFPDSGNELTDGDISLDNYVPFVGFYRTDFQVTIDLNSVKNFSIVSLFLLRNEDFVSGSKAFYPKNITMELSTDNIHYTKPLYSFYATSEINFLQSSYLRNTSLLGFFSARYIKLKLERYTNYDWMLISEIQVYSRIQEKTINSNNPLTTGLIHPNSLAEVKINLNNPMPIFTDIQSTKLIIRPWANQSNLKKLGNIYLSNTSQIINSQVTEHALSEYNWNNSVSYALDANKNDFIGNFSVLNYDNWTQVHYISNINVMNIPSIKFFPHQTSLYLLFENNFNTDIAIMDIAISINLRYIPFDVKIDPNHIVNPKYQEVSVDEVREGLGAVLVQIPNSLKKYGLKEGYIVQYIGNYRVKTAREFLNLLYQFQDMVYIYGKHYNVTFGTLNHGNISWPIAEFSNNYISVSTYSSNIWNLPLLPLNFELAFENGFGILLAVGLSIMIKPDEFIEDIENYDFVNPFYCFKVPSIAKTNLIAISITMGLFLFDLIKTQIDGQAFIFFVGKIIVYRPEDSFITLIQIILFYLFSITIITAIFGTINLYVIYAGFNIAKGNIDFSTLNLGVKMSILVIPFTLLLSPLALIASSIDKFIESLGKTIVYGIIIGLILAKTKKKAINVVRNYWDYGSEESFKLVYLQLILISLSFMTILIFFTDLAPFINSTKRFFGG